MERTTSTWGVYILALSFSLAFTACGPVNRFTRVKRIPREYAMNYCGTDIKASRSIWSGKAPWLCFLINWIISATENPLARMYIKN